jgi:hypothetical protein
MWDELLSFKPVPPGASCLVTFVTLQSQPWSAQRFWSDLFGRDVNGSESGATYPQQTRSNTDVVHCIPPSSFIAPNAVSQTSHRLREATG